jgi:CRP/FNR family transcriptional regulator, cyclic AMP receptor protein
VVERSRIRGVAPSALERKSQSHGLVIDLATLRLAPLVSEFPEAAQRALAPFASVKRYASRQTLWRAGTPLDHMVIVLEGRVRVVREGGTRQHVVHTEGPGGTLGEVPLFAGGVAPATAVALAPTRCLLLPRRAIEAAIAVEPGVAWLLLARLALRVRTLVERLDRLALDTVTARLAALLLAEIDAGRAAALPAGMTQTALAEELGTVREVVVRAVRSLCERGIVERVGRGRLRVVDIKGLRSIVSRDRE